jgi:iron complex transport system ATP-binding protein
MKIIEFTDVSFIREKETILKNISWSVQPKENWAILGLNGSGKTTLLQLITGNFWPSKGKLTILGQVFGQSSIPELKKRIGWVSTALQTQLHPYELAEKIVLSGKFASIGIYQEYTEVDLDEAKQTLTAIGGESFIGKSYKILSQGEKQLVLIARALIAKPELLILDEPCNGLDLFAREKLLTQIEKLATSKLGSSLLYVTHHTEEIPESFQDVLLLRNGEIFKQGKKQELFTENVLQDFYQKPVQIIPIKNKQIAVYPK